MSEPFILLARIEVSSETRGVLVAAAEECVLESRKEQGCLSYEFHENVMQPGRFVLLAHWETLADIERHRQSPHVVAFMNVLGTCVSSPAVVEVVEPRSIDRLEPLPLRVS